MSYDLDFSVREGSPEISDEEFAAYFKGRRHYRLNDTQAWYENEDTGVYFSFDYGDEEFDDEAINVDGEREAPDGMSILLPKVDVLILTRFWISSPLVREMENPA
jgi:hypothetical protein